jgi:hypothetical protein
MRLAAAAKMLEGNESFKICADCGVDAASGTRGGPAVA